MEIVPDLRLGDQDLAGGSVKIAEAIIMPQSLLIGRSLRDLNFRHRYGLAVIALHRRGQAFATKIGNLALRVGDVLLLQGDAGRFADLSGPGKYRFRDFIVAGAPLSLLLLVVLMLMVPLLWPLR